MILTTWITTAVVGKEERNKDFMANLVEDEHGNALGSDDVDMYRQEHGESSRAPVIEEKIKSSDEDMQMEKAHVEHAEYNKETDKQ